MSDSPAPPPPTGGNGNGNGSAKPDPAKPAKEDRPRLRPLEAYPVDSGGQKLLALRDPSGVAPHAVHLRPEAVAILQLCDGESTRAEIREEFAKRYGRTLTPEALDTLLGQLDDKLLLDSERFRHHSAQLFADFHRAEVREPFHAGRSYPADPAELRAFLNRCFEPPHGPGAPQPGTRDAPKALIAPHIDFHRGGPAYAWAYRSIADARELPELIVIFGTDHAGLDNPFTLTAKHYDTPLGRLQTDVELVEALKKACSVDLFTDEHHHRGEHSIEFQAVWLRHVLGARADGLKVLPVLCGSLHRFVEGMGDPLLDGAAGGFVRALVSAVAGRRVLWLAGADLAHVGPRFGDPEPLGTKEHEELQRADQVTLKQAAAGDAAGWFEALRKERDRRRVCGLTPIWAMLEAAKPGRGKLEAYGQCPAEEGSIVSIASIVY
jgi:AmmeMemoRadiSam system protein B